MPVSGHADANAFRRRIRTGHYIASGSKKPTQEQRLGTHATIAREAGDPDGDHPCYTILYNNGKDSTWNIENIL